MGKKPFNNPFAEVGRGMKKELVRQLRSERKAGPKARAPAPTSARSEAPLDDDAAFLAALADTTPLSDDPRGAARRPLPPPNAEHVPVYDEDAEALAELASLVAGEARFDISDSDEFISGGVEGLDRRVLQRLKRGDFAIRSHLDLHGLTRDAARESVEQFLTDQRRLGHRCVLIVHGRGLNSKDKIPVLKGLLKNWLERGRIARTVLAFCTARQHDGGAGAVYVLLRR